jgi:hypothetical protein
VQVDPTTPNSLYYVSEYCLAHSADQGRSWTPCTTAPGLEGPFKQLIVKNATTLILVRKGKAPLKTVDGGSTWAPMASLAALQGWPWLKLEGELSWCGNTLVVYGVDPNAARLRQAYGAFIWKSADDGDVDRRDGRPGTWPPSPSATAGGTSPISTSSPRAKA